MGRTKGAKNKSTEVKNNEALEAVKDLTLDKMSKEIGSVQCEIQNTLASAQAKVAQALSIKDQLDKAIELKKEELQQFHEIEVTATSLDELQAKVEEVRKSWEEEQVAKQKEFESQRKERELLWKREEEQYLYTKAQEHKKLEDLNKFNFEQIERANKLKNDRLEKDWSEREASLKSREQEVIELRKQVEDFPNKLKAEVDAKVAIATNSLKKEYETQIKLLNAENTSNLKLSQQELASANKTIDSLDKQIVSLKAQVDQANQRVIDISAKALEASSGRDTVETLKRALDGTQQSRQGK